MKFAKLNSFEIMLYISSALVLLFVVAPPVSMVLHTKFSTLFTTAAESEVSSSIFLTLAISFSTTILFSIVAVPLAYALVRNEFPLKSWIKAAINIPVVIPHSAAGIALLGFINRDSWLGQAAEMLGIRFVGTSWGIALAMAFVSVPFLINAAVEGFQAVPVRLEQAAANLGANRWRVFFTISLPLAKSNILSGLVLMFARGMSEFGAVIIIAYHPMITPVLIYERFAAYGLKYAQPVAVLFILISLLAFILLRTIEKKKLNKQ